MNTDRSWMWRRLDDNGYLLDEFVERVDEEFLSFAFANPRFVCHGQIKCPCTMCNNRKFLSRNDVHLHIVRNGFSRGYNIWYAHGESLNRRNDASGSSRVPSEEGSRYRTMVMDAVGPELIPNSICDEQPPNPETQNFSDLLKDADEPLWDVCKNHTKLSAVAQLLNIKSEYNMPEACYDRLVSIRQTQSPVDDDTRKLANGPSRRVSYYKGYFVNGFKFHTVEYGHSKATTNYGVCVLGSTYSECEVDYYGLLEEIVELEYYGLGRGVALFKCHWYDTSDKRLKRHKCGLVEINSKLKLSTDDPFILASQAQQVYFTSFPSSKRERRDWWAVCKVKAIGKFNIPLVAGQGENVEPRVENAFQEGEVSNLQPISMVTDLDGINIISDEEAEEVDLNEFEALRYTMNSNSTRIRDEEQDEEEIEEIESEEDEQDDEDHDSSDNDDDIEIDD
ncbi:hypothetical protein Salat_2096400 [Sesamum alatum]|uniref:Transposase-associated domain-containing protein n=1 Tax=Sesamum alatum TaxID=300844 RepID=A0AAE2CGM2_9LAMI|nr:hypothetical protein Salat_2096400 [Sesamum alatum]